MSRSLLTRLLVTTLALGIGAVLWVFLQTFSPAQDKIPSTVKIDLAKIPIDSYQELEWDNKPVVVFRLGPKSITELAALNDQTSGPYFGSDSTTTTFVYFRVSTHLGCGLKYVEKFEFEPHWSRVWHDPCHGAVWDRAGRLLSGSNRLGQRLPNLNAPSFRFLEGKRYVELL